MPDRDIGLIVRSAEVEEILTDISYMFDRDSTDNRSTPLPASAIGGGFGFPDKKYLICRRIYACGVCLASRCLPLTREEMARYRSNEAEDEWW
jgi:hypothetical protein